MKIKIVLFIVLLPLFLLINGCDSDSGIGQFDDIVIDSENSLYKFNQLTFIASFYNQEFGYLNLEIIDSLKLLVNGKQWGIFCSEAVDTTGRTSVRVNNLAYSEAPVKYLFIAPYQHNANNLETAGDYVDFMKARVALTPGGYICEIKEVKFRDLSGNLITKGLNMFAEFTVVENTTSSYIGNFNIPVN